MESVKFDQEGEGINGLGFIDFRKKIAGFRLFVLRMTILTSSLKKIPYFALRAEKSTNI